MDSDQRPKRLDFKPMTWAEFSKALDEYEALSYWQGYRDALVQHDKLKSLIKKQMP